MKPKGMQRYNYIILSKAVDLGEKNLEWSTQLWKTNSRLICSSSNAKLNPVTIGMLVMHDQSQGLGFKVIDTILINIRPFWILLCIV